MTGIAGKKLAKFRHEPINGSEWHCWALIPAHHVSASRRVQNVEYNERLRKQKSQLPKQRQRSILCPNTETIRPRGSLKLEGIGVAEFCNLVAADRAEFKDDGIQDLAVILSSLEYRSFQRLPTASPLLSYGCPNRTRLRIPPHARAIV